MTTDADARAIVRPSLALLCGLCRRLNAQRIGLDGRIVAMHAGDEIVADVLWQELEAVIEGLGNAAEQLAQVPAARLTEVRDKAEILAMLMRSDDGRDGPLIPPDKTRELALSLTDDLAGPASDTAAIAARWMTWLPAAVRGRIERATEQVQFKLLLRCGPP